MALITCPECGGKVSDKAEACPHCGCPIEKKIQTYKVSLLSVERHESSNLYFSLQKNLELTNENHLLGMLLQLEDGKINEYVLYDGISYENAEYALSKLSPDYCEAVIKESKVPVNKKGNEHLTDLRENIVHCPICGSKEIGVANRGFSVLWGPYGSGKSMNVCKNCGHKWTP